MAADQVAIAIATLGGIVERRTSRYKSPDQHAAGVLDPGARSEFGIMIAQVTAAALTSENKALAYAPFR